MKGILAVSLLISVANAGPFWGGMPSLFNPSRRSLIPFSQPPKPMHMHDHDHRDYGEPVHRHMPRCQLLENLFSFKQNTMPTCTLASICRAPETGDIIISELTEAQLMNIGRFQQDKFQNEMTNNNPNPCNGISDDAKNNNENENDSKNVEEDVAASPMPTYVPVITTPRYHGGEGLIDIRIGGDD